MHFSKYPLVLGMGVAMFLLNMAQFALHATWALSMQYRFKWTPKDIGMSLAAVGITSAIVQGGLSRRIVPALGERRSLMLGIGVGVLSYLGYGAATEGWMIFVVIGLASIGAIGFPAGQSLITKEVLATEQGAIQGAMASLQSMAGIVGPLIGGITLASFIREPRPFPDSPIPLEGGNFYVSALLALIGALAAAWALRHRGEVRTGVPAIPEASGEGLQPP
jgi:DHA1 family tetracycline resistance protein-like MFS transporter